MILSSDLIYEFIWGLLGIIYLVILFGVLVNYDLLKSKYTSRPKKIGKSITVKYNSKQPEEAIVVGKSVYVGALIFICFGIYAICSTLINNNSVDCCTCLDCPECDVCCDCNNP